MKKGSAVRIFVALGVLGVLFIGALTAAFFIAKSSFSDVRIQLIKVTIATSAPVNAQDPLGTLMGALGGGQAMVDTVFDVDNRNPLGASIESIDYQVLLNGQSVGKGHAPAEGHSVSVDPNSHASVTARTQFPITQLAAVGVQGALSGKLDVIVTGTAHFKVLFFPIEKDFSVAPSQVLYGGAAKDILQKKR